MTIIFLVLIAAALLLAFLLQLVFPDPGKRRAAELKASTAQVERERQEAAREWWRKREREQEAQREYFKNPRHWVDWGY
jgi:hypothetical protein